MENQVTIPPNLSPADLIPSEFPRERLRPAPVVGLARWISRIIHPIAFPLVTLAVLIYAALPTLATPARVSATAQFVVIALLLTSLPITLLVSFQVLRGRWSDLDVSVRRQRYTLYPFGLACMLALALVFYRLHAPRVAVRATLGIVLANLLDGLINFAYKVSAHTTGAAICATLLWFVGPAWGIPGAVAALAVGWSRVVLGRHTPGQVALGWLIGTGTTLWALLVILPGGL